MKELHQDNTQIQGENQNFLELLGRIEQDLDYDKEIINEYFNRDNLSWKL